MLRIPSGIFQSSNDVWTGGANSHWFHMVFNYIGPNNGQGIRFYRSGRLVQNVTGKFPYRSVKTYGIFVIGRGTELFSSLEVDKLLIFNHALTEAEITMLAQ